MGRNGDAIRAAKKLNAVYNPPKITGQWLAERVLEVIDDIRNDERKDIRDYAKETADLYGVRFTMEAANDG